MTLLALVVLFGLVLATVATLRKASQMMAPDQTELVSAPAAPRRGAFETVTLVTAVGLLAQCAGLWLGIRAYVLDPLPASEAFSGLAILAGIAFVAYLLVMAVEHRFAERRIKYDTPPSTPSRQESNRV